MRTQHPTRQDLRALARVRLGRALGFRDCAAATLDALVAAAEFRKLGKGESLVARGARFDALCLIVEGSLEASITRHDGHRHLQAYLQAGDLAGLMSLIGGWPHVNDLTARGPCSVMLTPGETVEGLRASDPRLGRAFELQLAFRSMLLHERLVADPSQSLESRVAQALQAMSRLYGLPRGDEVLLDMKISQADLADWLGAHRQRINVAIRHLEELGMIRARYSSIVVTDAAALAAFVRL